MKKPVPAAGASNKRFVQGAVFSINGSPSIENSSWPGDDGRQKLFPRKGLFPLFLSVFLLMCTGRDASPQAPDTAGREAVLIRGNYWVSGISGFGANGFSALAGEYRFEGFSYDPAREGDFAVYVTREPLYFSGEWQPRPGTGNIPVVQRTGDEGFLAAAVVDDGRGASWVAVFRFRQGLEGAGINGDVFNRMLRVWINRLSYFLSLSRAPGEVSLPAVLEF